MHKEWDSKIPKQSSWSVKKVEIPPAPLPDHLKVEPHFTCSFDDERLIGNSRINTKY